MSYAFAYRADSEDFGGTVYRVVCATNGLIEGFATPINLNNRAAFAGQVFDIDENTPIAQPVYPRQLPRTMPIEAEWLGWVAHRNADEFGVLRFAAWADSRDKLVDQNDLRYGHNRFVALTRFVNDNGNVIMEWEWL